MVAFEDSDRQDEPAPPDSPHVKKFRKELSSGLIALVLLALLARARGEMYGYEIAKTLGQAVAMASPYPLSIEELLAWAQALEQRGFALAPVSALAPQPGPA